jgi:magnesium-transporting ATPase (P-type)
MPVLQVLRQLESGPRGLDEEHAQTRLGHYGENVIAASGRRRRGARLAVAIAERPMSARPHRPADEQELTLMGFVGFRDHPRDSAPAAITALADRGVTVKVLTGDHPLVAARICDDAGIDPGRIVLGEDSPRSAMPS